MKKYLLPALATLSLMAVACNKQTPDVDTLGEEEVEFIYYADYDLQEGEDGTRTVRQEDGKVWWSPCESIAVIKSNASQTAAPAKFTASNDAPAAKTYFAGTRPGTSGTYWGIYPYSDQIWVYNSSLIVVPFTNEQTAIPGSFPDGLYIAGARTASTIMHFTHPLGGVKFSMESDNVVKAYLASNGGEAIASDLLLLGYSSAKTKVSDYNIPYNYIELTPEDGTFIPGEAYYFVTMPATLESGLSIYLVRDDGSVLVRSVNQSVTISRASFRTLMDADAGCEWATPNLKYTYDEGTVRAAGDVFNVYVNYWGEYTVHVDDECDWIHPMGTSGDPRFGKGCTHAFKVDQNTGEERSAVISVCYGNNCYPVLVNQADGAGTKMLTHHSLGMRFTATWCGYCPNMNESFKLAKEQLGDKFEIVNLHGGNSDLEFGPTNTLANLYKVSGYPTGIIDGRRLIQNYASSYAASLIVDAVNETELYYPTMSSTGISSSLDGSALSVDLDVFIQQPGKYKLTVLLLENGIVNPQEDYIFSDGDLADFRDNGHLLAVAGMPPDQVLDPSFWRLWPVVNDGAVELAQVRVVGKILGKGIHGKL